MGAGRPTILLADEQAAPREALRLAIEARHWGDVVAQTSDGREAVEMARRLAPTLAVLDVELREMSGIDAARRIVETTHTRALVLSRHEDRRHVEEALRAGALGYVTKQTTLDELGKALAAVAGGQPFVSSDVARHLVRALEQPWGRRGPGEELSGREREVLRGIADGLSSKEIAARLHISVATVQSHRSSIMAKAGVHKAPGLVRFAIREGIVEP